MADHIAQIRSGLRRSNCKLLRSNATFPRRETGFVKVAAARTERRRSSPGGVFLGLRFFGSRGAYGRVAARRSSGRPSVKASCNSSGGSGDASVRCLRGGGLGGAAHNRNTQFDFSCLLSWRVSRCRRSEVLRWRVSRCRRSDVLRCAVVSDAVNSIMGSCQCSNITRESITLVGLS